MAETVLEKSLRLVDDRVRFLVDPGGEQRLFIDAPPPTGHEMGASPMALFLSSLASCTGITVLSLLRDRMHRTVTGMIIDVRGKLRTKHPKAFETIDLYLTIRSPDATDAEVRRAIDSAEKKVCPVTAMVRGHVQIRVDFKIETP